MLHEQVCRVSSQRRLSELCPLHVGHGEGEEAAEDGGGDERETAMKVPVGRMSARVRRAEASSTSPMPQTTDKRRKMWRPLGSSCSRSKAETLAGSLPAAER